jgi:hypothetical protein
MDYHHPDFPGLASGPALGIEEELSTALFRTTASQDGIKFWPWVNKVVYFPLYRIPSYGT